MKVKKITDGVKDLNINDKTYKDAKQKVKSFDGGGDELKQERINTLKSIINN